MTRFTLLEQTAMIAIVDETIQQCAIIKRQLARAYVRSRENTGGGFLTELNASASPDRVDEKTNPLGLAVYVGIEGLEYGLGMILHFKEGYANLLEGYSVGGEDTSTIDFANVRYALIREPGPLPPIGT